MGHQDPLDFDGEMFEPARIMGVLLAGDEPESAKLTPTIGMGSLTVPNSGQLLKDLIGNHFLVPRITSDNKIDDHFYLLRLDLFSSIKLPS